MRNFSAVTQNTPNEMKLPTPYQCDYCGTIKKESNNWWLLNVNTGVTVTQGVNGPSVAALDQFLLLTWHIALVDNDDYEHICSESCAIKALSKWMHRNKV